MPRGEKREGANPATRNHRPNLSNGDTVYSDFSQKCLGNADGNFWISSWQNLRN